MLYLLAHLQVVPRHKRNVLEALGRLSVETLNEPGCIQYEILEDLPISLEERESLPSNLIMISEIWRSEADLRVHLELEHLKAFRSQTAGWVEETRLNTLSRVMISPAA